MTVRLHRLHELDPRRHESHELHGDDRTFSQSNCYVDCLVELVAALGLEPLAMLGGAVAVDFEIDQWTFFKPAPGDLLRLYGIDVHEVQPYRGFPDLIASRLAAGQFVMLEVDSFHLPDVAATAYRTTHTKSSIIPGTIDPAARSLRYFHNAGYYELSGDDYDRLLTVDDGHLPGYVELVRPDAGPVPVGAELKATARAVLRDHLARRPATNPFSAFAARLETDLPELLEESPQGYHAYAFHNPRMVGAAVEMLAAHLRWLLGEEAEPAAAQHDDIVAGSKMLLFRLARQRPFDVAGAAGPMAPAWASAMTAIEGLLGSPLDGRVG